AVGVVFHARPGDRLFGAHRSHAHFLALGGSVRGLLAEVQGKQTGASRGMGGSIGRGVAALPPAAAAVILLGDMPEIVPATIRALIGAFAAAGKDICVPVAEERRGNPVLFGRAHFEALGSIHGDRGGKGIVAANPSRVVEVAVTDPGVLADYDTLLDGESDVSEGR
ncbi:MAG: NTP transferase domain-containing protein, partial [Rhodospirillales bacterium]|nr:NTP transferase domain-containing protein [Rhodospirillales bacterium]